MFSAQSTHSLEVGLDLTHSIEVGQDRSLLYLTHSSHSEEVRDSQESGIPIDSTQNTSSNPTQIGTEIVVYCQNFNRMKSSLKIREIHNKILSCSFPIILANETSWDEGVRSEEVFGCNYNVYRDDRNFETSEKKSGGGVLVAVSIQFNSEIISTEKCEEFEHVWVKILVEGETHVFASVYFPPNNARKNSYDKFFQIADEIMSKLSPEVKVHIFGDFNQRSIDFIPDADNECILLPIVGDNETLQFLFDKIASLGLNQVNHIKNKQNNYLDFLLTNMYEDFCVSESLTPLWKNEAFHTAIELSIFVHKNNRPDDCEYEEVFQYHSANYENIRERLNRIDWQTILRSERNVEASVDVFYKLLFEIILDEVPLKRIRRRNHSKTPVWYNEQIKNLKNRKQKAHKKYKRNNNNENLTSYLSICDQLNQAIDNAYEDYNLKTENEIKSCPKNFFNYVKTKLKSDNFPSIMHLDKNVGDSSEKICNLFAFFFQEIYTTFDDEDRDCNYFDFLPEYTRDIEISHINVKDVMEGLNKLDVSKGSGPDGIPPLFMKSLAVELTTPLFWLFNMSLESGIFPKSWKSSYLVPIFKNGKKSDIRNYRGIAIISCIPKLFEAIINEKLFNQIKSRITNAQHGFFKGRSTNTNLIEFVNYSLTAMDNGHHVEALYTDFSKAFDRVDIPMLLFKLQKLGIESNLLKWIESYLTNRQQIVRFKGSKSNPIQVTSGVPQGSHLGPLLFILFVNDISLILKHIKVLIYADDMKLYLEIINKEDINIFQNEIKVFYTWCNKSLLQLNVKKCNLIAFSRKRDTPNVTITLGNQPVVKCDRVRDLGVILDSKLTFIDHYNTIINRANNMLGFIKRFSYSFHDPYTIKTLYTAYVRSIIEYCSVVWSPFSITHEERIESVQKQFLLFALRKLGWTRFPLPSYKARCMLINIQTLKVRREFAMVSFVNDIVSHRIDSAELLAKLNFYAPFRQLRNRNIFLTCHHRTNYAKYGPLNQMMATYNKHCASIDFTTTKTKLKRYFNSVR